MPKVSVIVPVYNAAPYMQRCITSLLAQTLQDIEIIMVDDGSTDNSADIIRSCMVTDHRLKLVQCENGGVSRARNTGMDAASGEYVGFVDADDWVDADMYEGMYETSRLHNLDVCICGFYWEYPGRKPVPADIGLPGGVLLPRYAVERDLILGSLYGATFGSVWKALVRRKLLSDERIRFCEELDSMEDNIFNLHLYIHARSILYTGRCSYHYRKMMDGSLSRKYRAGYMKLVRDLLRETDRILEAHRLPPQDTRDPYDLGLLFMAVNSIYNTCSRGNRAPVRIKVREIRQILEDGSVDAAISGIGQNACFRNASGSASAAIRAAYSVLKVLLMNRMARTLFLVFTAISRFGGLMFYFENYRSWLAEKKNERAEKLSIVREPSA